MIAQQLDWFGELALQCGVANVTHVKPHGALYNAAIADASIARAIVAGTRRWRSDVALVGLAGSLMLDVFRDAGFEVWAEGFADRAYETDGSLCSRKLPGAMIEDPLVAAAQAMRLFASGAVDTVCVHSDTAGSVAIARGVRDEMARMVDTCPPPAVSM
jgi:5-oxoprolinase (ATP-hydrolysing) subunit A